MNQKPDKAIPALYGGIIMGVVCAIPVLNFVNCFCCAGILLGGFLAVMFYKNNFTPDTPPFTAGDCMLVGVFAGIVGALIETALSLLFTALFGNIMLQIILDILQNSNLQIPAQYMDKIEAALREKASIMHVIVNFFSVLVLNSIFGMLGGLIGFSVYKPKPALMPPPPPMANPAPGA